jgi:hypothetical protein
LSNEGNVAVKKSKAWYYVKLDIFMCSVWHV